MKLNTETLRTLMTQQELKGKDLAEMIDKTPAYLSQLLSGKRNNPSFELVSTLAQALNVEVATILLEDNNKEVDTLKINYDIDDLFESEVEQIKALKKLVGIFDFDALEIEQIAQHMQILKNSRHLF